MTEVEKSRGSYIRVTEVLYPFSGLQNINLDVVENAARRGGRVHKICEGIVTGIGEHDVDEEVWGYVQSFKHWWGEGRNVIEVEKRFWCDENQFTGQVDMILQTDYGMAILDIKTSANPSKTWEAQGKAYAYLARKSGYDIKKIYFLHLNKHGKNPRILEYPVDDEFFLSILKIYKFFFRKD
jgi:hypothetical protein